MDREKIKETLIDSICDVRFTKVDGTVRDMRCTLKAELLPDAGESEETTKKTVNESVLPVWDLDKKAWRSFRVDSVIDMQMVVSL